MSELRALTGLRGLAAWFVVLYHIRGSIAGLPRVVEAVFAKGYLAVDLFFLLSGFVIWLAWHDRVGGSALLFLRRRVARIWPLHLVMLGFGAVLAAVLGASGRATPEFPWSALPLHVMLVQNWGLTDRLAWNDPAWSISCELAAYLLFPLLVACADWRRVPTAARLAIAAGLMLTLHFGMRGAPTLGFDIPRFGLLRCLCEFGTGTILCALWMRRVALRVPLAVFVTAAIAWIAGVPETLAVPACLAGLLLVVAITAGRVGNPLEGRAIHYLGDISYATYLGHFLLWKAFKLAFVPDAGAVPPVTIAAYLAVVLASSAALYHLVERPAQRWINGTVPPRRRPGRVVA